MNQLASMSSPPLSSLVVVSPLQLDGREDLINLQQDVNTDRLAGVLIRLSTTIAKNGKVTNCLAEEVQELKGHRLLELQAHLAAVWPRDALFRRPDRGHLPGSAAPPARAPDRERARREPPGTEHRYPHRG